MNKIILIADDDQVFVDLLSEFLKDHGFEIETASDAMHASIIAFRPPHPDLILLDIRMPAGSGLAVLKRLRGSDKTRNIPIIAVSADPSSALPEEVRSLGATEFAQKPVDLISMGRVIFKLLGMEWPIPAAV
jgi:CheY-like chemotaxis protein